MIYRYVLNSEVAEDILQLSSNQRARFIEVFRELAQAPFQKGEEMFQDSIGREIQKKKFGRWLISFWADHAVKEIRIVGLQRQKA